ncbi:hypothetical protein A33Q_0095 [Indibacter alkaliphilus LW1]|uniref:Uncharacterized protein n=1 Tax=Indibacter alkaliphilus (strain CCUG 57479 / KCTC 22604 / LW1) TaxID=1189612 RepID=S2DN02_INDAL|nr:hypothetical protein A33Q_0095 [Indibacter alkaliphilus LW1]
MVRLKGVKKTALLLDCSDFNSCMVRLKETFSDYINDQRINFNSCMVRLKEKRDEIHLNIYLEFQFLYGAIEGILE